MKRIRIQYTTCIPDNMTFKQIHEWLEYVLTERGELSEDNPLKGAGPEPDEGSIEFHVTEDLEERSEKCPS